MLKLFNTNYEKILNDPNALFISTPLGKVVLEVFFDEKILSTRNSQVTGKISESSFIYVWDFENLHIELLKTKIAPSLPQGMFVDECVALLWKFKCLSKKIRLKFVCQIVPAKNIEEKGPESGEGLIAQSWINGNIKITMGTEDEEFLISRAKFQENLPIRFAEEGLLEDEIIKYRKYGLEIAPPDFWENEEGQFQFIISWTHGDVQKNISTWFAMDQKPTEILKKIAFEK